MLKALDEFLDILTIYMTNLTNSLTIVPFKYSIQYRLVDDTKNTRLH